MRENPNRSNIEPKLNYSINLINNIDSYIRNASVGVKIADKFDVSRKNRI